jgi:hypothetical protein
MWAMMPMLRILGNRPLGVAIISVSRKALVAGV